jgi:hypothetical protein
MRSGDIMLSPVLELMPGITVGKLLIQRDENSKDKRAVVRKNTFLTSFSFLIKNCQKTLIQKKEYFCLIQCLRLGIQ